MRMAKLFIISASSGAGKTSVINGFLEKLGNQGIYERIVTYTSRSRRKGEHNTIDYMFISSQEFLEKIAQGFFIEWSEAYGNYYGSPRLLLDRLALGISCFIIVDHAGAQRLAAVVPQAIKIWITVSLELLRQRLKQRGTESEIIIEQRLRLARQEQEQALSKETYDYYIMNDQTLEQAVTILESIVQKEDEKGTKKLQKHGQ